MGPRNVISNMSNGIILKVIASFIDVELQALQNMGLKLGLQWRIKECKHESDVTKEVIRDVGGTKSKCLEPKLM